MIERNEEQKVTDQHTEKALRQQRTIFNKDTEKKDWWLETPEEVVVIVQISFLNDISTITEKVGDDAICFNLFDENLYDNWGYACNGNSRDTQGVVTDFILSGKAGSTDLTNFRFNKMSKGDIRSCEITVKDYLKVNKVALHGYYKIVEDLQPIMEQWSKLEKEEEYEYKELEI